jgi:drug/metabolite transporter (DMT)-like permease
MEKRFTVSFFRLLTHEVIKPFSYKGVLFVFFGSIFSLLTEHEIFQSEMGRSDYYFLVLIL